LPGIGGRQAPRLGDRPGEDGRRLERRDADLRRVQDRRLDQRDERGQERLEGPPDAAVEHHSLRVQDCADVDDRHGHVLEQLRENLPGHLVAAGRGGEDGGRVGHPVVRAARRVDGGELPCPRGEPPSADP
jgi:hypothetical protein